MRIRTRLLFYILPLIILPILVLGFFSYRSLKGGFEEQVQLEGEHLSQMTASRIEEKLDECYADMLVLQSEASKEWSTSSAFSDGLTTGNTLTGRLAQRFVIRHSPFVQARIVRADGKELLVVRGLHQTQERGSALNDAMFMPAVAMSFSKRIPIQFPIDTISGNPITTFSAPVFSSTSLVGFVFFDLDLRFAARIVNEMAVFQPGRYILFDDAGKVIAEDSSRSHGHAEFLKSLVGSSSVGTHGHRLSGSMFPDNSYLTIRPVKEYIAFREPIPEERWYIAVAPTASPLQAAFHRTQILFFLILALALTSGIIGTVLVSRNITRPIGELAHATERFAKGNLEANIPIQSRDEIGALTSDFNTMASDLRTFLLERQTNETLLAIGRVSSSLVHDLRNPIEGLKLLSAELMKRAEHGGPEYEVADTIHQSIARLSSLLTQSLNFARLAHPEFSPTDIVSLADDAVADIRPSDVVIRKQYDNKIPPVEVDAVQLKRVLSNILLNAVDACRNNKKEAPGIVNLNLRTDGASIKIEISDNGPGVEPELHEKIFEPFFSTKPEGHGLGLSFGRQIIKNHGGELLLISEPGQGATFVIILPQTRHASTT